MVGLENHRQCTTSLSEMRHLRTLAIALAVLSPVANVTAQEAVRLDVGASSVLFLSKDPRFSLRGQFGSSATLSLEAAVSQAVSLGVQVGLLRVPESDVVDLVRYRGFGGGHAGLFVSVATTGPGSGEEPAPTAGLRAGLEGGAFRYVDTELLFVAPGVVVEPFLALPVVSLPWLAIRVAAPLSWYFRPDLSVSASVGLSFAAQLRLGRRDRDRR